MKKRLVILAAVVVASAGMLAAQAPGRRGGGRGAGQGTPPAQGQMQQRHLDRLATLLELTPAQKEQASQIFASTAQQSAPLREKMQVAESSLREAVKTNNPVAIDNHAAEVGRLMGEMRAVHAKAAAEFYQSLTAEQRTKWDSLRGGPGMFPGGMRMGPGGMSPMGGRRQMHRAPAQPAPQL